MKVIDKNKNKAVEVDSVSNNTMYMMKGINIGYSRMRFK